MNNTKMVNAAKNLDTLVRILGKICRVVAIVVLIMAVLVLIFGSKMFATGSFSMDLDFIKLYLADEYQTATTPLIAFACIGLAVVGAICFMIHYASGLLCRILAPMKEGRPFEADAPACLRKTAWLSLIGGTLIQACGIAERILMTKIYPVDAIFASEAISRVEYSYTIDFNFVFIFCVLMFLSYIFAYGRQLQQESDETL